MKWNKIFLTLILAVATTFPASAQYSDIINGITNTIAPALSGAGSYKGFVDLEYTQGFGRYRTNFMTVSTSQGYKFTDWFYMGAGVGVDILWSTVNKGWGEDWSAHNPDWYSHEHTSSAVMIPVFSDFRFMLGAPTSTSFFINLRVGAAFLCTDSYIQIRDGYLTDQRYFYMQPSVGLRVPINQTNPKQAIDIGLHYRLMTSDYWANWQYNATINGLGVNVAYEW